MIQVLPAIIPHTKSQMEEEMKKVSSFAKLVQVDITDGVFVPTTSWPYNGRDQEYFEALKTEDKGWPEWEDVDVELHLMVKNPEHVLLDWIQTGVVSIVAHIEATDNFHAVIDMCRNHNVSVGVAIKPSTDTTRIAEFVPLVDFIQCMGSDMLGKHGTALDDKAVEQIKTLHSLYPDSIISVDIGVSEESAQRLVDAGARKFIAGSAILDAENPREVFNKLKWLN